MTQTTLNGYRLLMVDVPEDASPYLKNGYIAYKYYNGKLRKFTTRKTKIPPGDWQLLGLASEVTEEEAAGVVEKNQYGHNGWKTYTERKMYWEETATASLCSFVRSHNMEPETTVILIDKSKK